MVRKKKISLLGGAGASSLKYLTSTVDLNEKIEIDKHRKRKIRGNCLYIIP